MPPNDDSAPAALLVQDGVTWRETAVSGFPAALAIWRVTSPPVAVLALRDDPADLFGIESLPGAFLLTTAALLRFRPDCPVEPVPQAPRTLVRAVLDDGPEPEPVRIIPEPAPSRTARGVDRYTLDEPLSGHLRTHIPSLPPRLAKAVSMRFPEGRPPVGLDAIGEALNATAREADRLVGSGLSRIDAATGVASVVSERLRVVASVAPYPFEHLLAETWAEGLSDGAAAEILLRWGTLHVFASPRLGRVAVPTPPEAWEAFERDLAALLRKAPADRPLAETLEAFVSNLHGNPEDRDARARMARVVLGDLTLLAACWWLGLLDRVADLLMGKGADPVHLDAMLERAEAEVPGRLDRASLHAMMSSYALHVGGDRFSRRKSSADAPSRLAVRHCAALVADAAEGASLSTAELLASLRAAYPGYEGMDEAYLDQLLFRETQLFRDRPGTWAVAGTDPSPTQEDRAIEVLRLAGGPLRIAELRRRCAEAYGTPAHMDLRPADLLVPVDRGVWGLADRDLALDGIEDAAAKVRGLMAAGPMRIDEVFLALSGTAAGGGGGGAPLWRLPTHAGPEPAPAPPEAPMTRGRHAGPYPLRKTYPKERKPPVPFKSRFVWTPERIDVLVSLWNRRATRDEIIRTLGGGLTKNAITGKAHRLGLFGRNGDVQANGGGEAR
jgi:hypothetical protein